jgi:hypothetical protein
MAREKSIRLVQRCKALLQSRRFQWVVGALLFLLINGYIGYRLYKDWGQIQSIDWLHLDVALLVLTAGMQFFGLLIAIASWRYILQRCGYAISLRAHFKIYTISNLVRKLPGIGLGILSRVYMYRQHGVNEIQMSVTSLTEIVMFGLAGAIIALVGTLLPGGYALPIHPLILIGVLAAFIVLIPSPLFRRFLLWINRGNTETLQLRWYHLLAWVGLSTIITTIGGLTLFLFCLAFGSVDSTAMVPLIQGWALTITSGSLLFWLPESKGVTSGIVVVILATMMPMPQAIVLLIAWRIWNSLNEVLWGGVGFVV